MIYLKAFLALALIILLIVLLGFILRRLNRGVGFSSKEKRLFMEDMIVLGGKHRLVLVRCEKKEYLVLLGGESDMVIDYYNKGDV